MKALLFTLVLISFSLTTVCQNLISNGDFEDSAMTLDCSGWYNMCGDELSLNCSQFGSCAVNYLNESPLSGHGWSIHTFHDWPYPPFAETYITGQSGTHIYQLSYYMKSDTQAVTSLGTVSLGLGSQDLFSLSVSSEKQVSDWEQFTIIDTLTTSPNDTITVRLSSGDCDFCLNKIYFDLIELTAQDITSTAISNSPLNEIKVNVYPNPSSDYITFSLSSSLSIGHVLSIYNSSGQTIRNFEAFDYTIAVDSKSLTKGNYFYKITESNSLKIIGEGKFLIQ